MSRHVHGQARCATSIRLPTHVVRCLRFSNMRSFETEAVRSTLPLLVHVHQPLHLRCALDLEMQLRAILPPDFYGAGAHRRIALRNRRPIFCGCFCAIDAPVGTLPVFSILEHFGLLF